ncbi:MAG: dipeptidase PepE, partial [Actinomycetota bacterium]|nr:dipeptidase PepE [Actinomycetota bacterium]
REYLEHARDHLREFLGPAPRRLAFVPYAAVTFSWNEYAERVRAALGPLGHIVESVHEDEPTDVLRHADGIVVGGGNTFRLLEQLERADLLTRIRVRVQDGLPYVGWSAGANLACPTIRTTNDMPIIQPGSFTALGLVPFQINPHYTSATLPDHGGESRDDRIVEFLALNPKLTVAGLREGSLLRVEGERVTLLGPHAMRVFRAGSSPAEVRPGALTMELHRP